MTKRSWVQTLTMENIFQAPLIWIKAWNKNCGKTLIWHCCMCCNPTNGRVDFEEWSAYKIQLHGTEWIESLSADKDESPKKKKKKFKKHIILDFFQAFWSYSGSFSVCNLHLTSKSQRAFWRGATTNGATQLGSFQLVLYVFTLFS